MQDNWLGSLVLLAAGVVITRILNIYIFDPLGKRREEHMTRKAEERAKAGQNPQDISPSLEDASPARLILHLATLISFLILFFQALAAMGILAALATQMPRILYGQPATLDVAYAVAIGGLSLSMFGIMTATRYEVQRVQKAAVRLHRVPPDEPKPELEGQT